MNKFIFCFLALVLGLSAISAWAGNGNKLSDYERRGLYFCSTEGTLDAVAKEDDFYTIIFLEVGPVTFKKSELSPELKNKIEGLILGEKAKIACVHPAFRDDWQEVYGRDKHVWPKLIDLSQSE